MNTIRRARDHDAIVNPVISGVRQVVVPNRRRRWAVFVDRRGRDMALAMTQKKSSLT